MKTQTFKPKVETEKQIQDYLLKRLVAAGWLAVRQNSGMQMIGAPGRQRPFLAYTIANNGAHGGVTDVWACRENKILLVEVKNAKGKARPSQENFARLAADCGTVVYLVRSKDDVDNLLREISA